MAKEINHGGDMEPVVYRDGVLEGTGNFSGELGIFYTDSIADAYQGETTVIPKASADTVLPTKDTLVKEDITVKQIPFYATSNEAGGSTIYIAKE